MVHVTAAVDPRQRPDRLEPGDVADHAQVEPAVCHQRVWADLHAAAVVHPVGEGHEEHATLDLPLAVRGLEGEPNLTVVKAPQLPQRRQGIPQAAAPPATSHAGHGGGNLRVDSEATSGRYAAPAR